MVLVLAWLLPTLAVALAVWLVLERGWLWWRVEADTRRARREGGAPKATVASPGAEACKAALITVAGIAMIAGPHIGDDDTTLGALGRLIAWAWSVPLGVVFLGVGLIGLRAMFTAGGRPTSATRKAAA